jgi:hypothetical protein
MSKLDRLIAKHTRPQEREDVPKVFDEYLFADSLISALKDEMCAICKKEYGHSPHIRGCKGWKLDKIKCFDIDRINLAYNALKGEGK